MKATAKSDIGRKRDTNEDFVFCSPVSVGKCPNLFIVADGMGGENAGEYASGMTIREMVKSIRETGKSKSKPEILYDAIREANSKLFGNANADSSHKGMGSTVVAAEYDSGILNVINVGDSRLYLINKDGIRQITNDHSYVEEMVRLGRMNRGSEDYKKKKNIITRAVGAAPDIQADMFEVSIDKDDTVLMCTDGLTNMVSDEEILKIVNESKTTEEAAERLIDTANEYGGDDNITVIVISDFEEK